MTDQMLYRETQRQVWNEILQKAFTPQELEQLRKDYAPPSNEIWVLSCHDTPFSWHNDPQYLMKRLKEAVTYAKMERVNEHVWVQTNGPWRITKIDREPDKI